MEVYDWLHERVERAKSMCQRAGGTFEFIPGAPVTESSLRECEKAIGQRLPESFRMFLQLADGAVLNWAGRNQAGLIRILSARDVVSERSQMRAVFDPEYEQGETRSRWGLLLPIVDCYHGNFLVADPEIKTDGDAAILYANHEESPQSWREFCWVAARFDLLLMRMFDEIGYLGFIADYWTVSEPVDSRRRLKTRVRVQ